MFCSEMMGTNQIQSIFLGNRSENPIPENALWEILPAKPQCKSYPGKRTLGNQTCDFLEKYSSCFLLITPIFLQKFLQKIDPWILQLFQTKVLQSHHAQRQPSPAWNMWLNSIEANQRPGNHQVTNEKTEKRGKLNSKILQRGSQNFSLQTY